MKSQNSKANPRLAKKNLLHRRKSRIQVSRPWL